jgi:hypothetical protein
MRKKYTSLCIILLAFVFSQVEAQYVNFRTSRLPIIIIKTEGKTIVDEPKIPVKMGIIHHTNGQINQITDSLNVYNGLAGIEFRGSSSQMFPKKSYGIETWESEEVTRDVSLLGMPAESDWVLYAPYSDKSLLRSDIIYYLARQMGQYATRTQFCELVINDQYQGLYVLEEKIKRGKSRVPIDKLTTSDITGGYILKIDKFTGNFDPKWTSPFKPYINDFPVNILIEYPKAENLLEGQKQYIQKYVTDFETALDSKNFRDPITGYRKFIDVPSFVDYFLINELCKNVDGYRISTYFYKDRDIKNPHIFMGPVWDYDLAFGNANYYNGYAETGWAYLNGDNYPVPFWWQKLLSDPYFTNQLKIRWTTLRKNILSTNKIEKYIDSMTTYLGDAKDQNFQKWPILGIYIWPNYKISKTYQEEILWIKNWINNRLLWLDNNLPGSLEPTVDIEKSEPDLLWSIYPNPATDYLTISFVELSGKPLLLNITTLSGESVLNKTITNGTANQYFVRIGHLHIGMYLLTITREGIPLVKKRIVVAK